MLFFPASELPIAFSSSGELNDLVAWSWKVSASSRYSLLIQSSTRLVSSRVDDKRDGFLKCGFVCFLFFSSSLAANGITTWNEGTFEPNGDWLGDDGRVIAEDGALRLFRRVLSKRPCQEIWYV